MKHTRWLDQMMGLTLILLLLAACASPAPTATPVPPTPTPIPPTPTSVPPTPTTVPTEEVTEWDLVFINDPRGWGVAERYAAHIENDLGITVTVYDLALSNLSLGRVLRALRGEGQESHAVLKDLRDIIPDAEVVVFFANPVDSISEKHPGDWNCDAIAPKHYVVDCSLETFEKYKADLDAFYEQVFALRGDAPTIIRAVDPYATYSIWEEVGVVNECTACWETLSGVLRQAAAKHNVPFVSVYDAFNGPNHDQDPREKGYIEPGGLRTSELGQQVYADLLREVGYDPVPTPVPPVEVEELTVTFERDHCIYDGPKVIRQGEVTIIFNNLTDADAGVSVGKIENGKTWQDLVDHFSEKNIGVAPPKWTTVVSHRPVIGDYRAQIFNLEPGLYAISCGETLQGSWAIWLASPLEVR